MYLEIDRLGVAPNHRAAPSALHANNIYVCVCGGGGGVLAQGKCAQHHGLGFHDTCESTRWLSNMKYNRLSSHSSVTHLELELEVNRICMARGDA